MGDKIHYYCLNESMICDILPSQSVIFGHRVCAHQELHSQIPPEPNRGLWPTLLLYLHSIHTHFGHFHTRGWICFSEPVLQLLNTISAQSSISFALNRSKLRQESRWAPSHDPRCISGKASSFVSVVEYSHRFTNPPFSSSRGRYLMPQWKVDHM